jgi:hypothetical protein
MALPVTLKISLDFSSGATFGYPMILGTGILDQDILGVAGSATLIADLTSVTRQINITRGRSIGRDTYEAGTAIVTVYDNNGDFNPQNTSSPYYPYVTPLRKIRISATYGGTDYFLYSGYVQNYAYRYDQAENVGYTDIYCSDAFRLFNLAIINAITGQAAGQDIGTRINKILDTVDFPAGMRNIDTGNSTAQADTGALRTSLAAIQAAEFSEQGAVYVDAEGSVVFKNRTNTIAASGTTPISFNQTGGIPYKNIKLAFDDKLILNVGKFKRVGGVEQVYTDDASVATYFPHTLTAENLILETDAEVLNAAALFISSRSDTTIRIDEMTIDMLDTNVPTATILGIDYFTNALVSNIQPDGSTITKNLSIQGVRWDITPNTMLATFLTTEPISDGFILGNTTYGQLNDDILSY